MGTVMSRPVKKLFDLEIDEVSVVDRAANQHSLIAIAKSLGGAQTLEDPMTVGQVEVVDELELFDAAGNPVEELAHGTYYYDAEGREFFYDAQADLEEDDEDGEDLDEGDDADEADEAEDGEEDFGKAAIPASAWGIPGAALQGKKGASMLKGPMRLPKEGLSVQREGFRDLFAPRTVTPGKKAKGWRGKHGYYKNNQVTRRADWRNIGIGATGVAAAGAAGYGASQMSKSLSESVLERLSKAVSEKDREEVVVGLAQELEVYKAATEELVVDLEAERDARIEEVFISKAAEYNLPIDPQTLGGLMFRIAKGEAATVEDMELLDELFSAVGDALYDEVGYLGESSNNSVIDVVDAYADELVGKSGLTREQAFTAMLENNPAAYDAYINEMGR
jgi:hypothetical protein